MTSSAPKTIDCPTERALLCTLLYFEIFSYPLTQEETFHYCGEHCVDMAEVSEKLQNLVEKGFVYQNSGFYQTTPDPLWVQNRLECNQRADQFLPIARHRAAFIGKFPFVRGVFISGSLSKHCMRPDSDIDFFVITEPGRLWLARTLLVLFKKIFLFNSHKLFCVNYFIDNNHLAIEERNLFTATEIVTLLPMYGREYFEAFSQKNTWAWEQYPNFPPRDAKLVPPHLMGFLKRLTEKMLGGQFGAWLDEKSMQITVGFWKRKFKHLNGNSFDIALKSRRYVSKHHPLHFQQKVLERFEARVQECAANF